MVSRFQQVIYQTHQNIHALIEEAKKQEHSPRNDLFNVLLGVCLAIDQRDQVSSSDQP